MMIEVRFEWYKYMIDDVESEMVEARGEARSCRR